MDEFSKIMRDFLAAMPVVGPHAYIECELLLAGKKPVGFMPVYTDVQADADWTRKKYARDVKLLDKAVAEGKLKSADLYLNASGTDIIRHYCQPDRLKDMQRVFCLNRRFMTGEKSDIEDLGKEYATLLGYRKRDVKFFSLYIDLPQSFGEAIRYLNQPSQQIMGEKLLAECGIPHDKWIEQLRAENIIP